MVNRSSFCYLLINFIFMMLATNVQAENWKYSITNDSSYNMTAIGYKVDQNGDRLDNNTYKAKFDSLTTSQKSLFSNYIFRKLTTNIYSAQGVEEITSLLIGVGWQIDKTTQSIYRYKTSNGQTSCKNFGSKWSNEDGYVGDCPQQVAENYVKNHCNNMTDCKVVILATSQNYSQSISTLPDDAKINKIYVRYSGIWGGGLNYFATELNRADLIVSTEKEYLDVNGLLQYMLGTHSDFDNDTYKSKLPAKNTKTGILKAYQYFNDYELKNAPTVLYVISLLNGSQPESDNTTIKPNEPVTNPDGSTSSGGFNLPSFCDWAKPVCDFFREYVLDKEDTKVDIQDNSLNIDEKPILNFKNTCPEPSIIHIAYMNHAEDIEFSYQPICKFLMDIRLFVIGAAYILGAYIVMGLSRGNSE